MNYTDNEIAQERWKPIFGYDGMYEVSSLGRVRSLKFGKVRVLSVSKNNSGYLQVVLCKDGKVKHLLIHRLVANAFIPNDNIFNTEINHRNEDKTENKVSNLEWCSAQYNNTYNDLHLRKKNVKRHKLKDLYDPNLSIPKNIEIFRAHGVECCEKTVLRLRKDLGLVKHKQN